MQSIGLETSLLQCYFLTQFYDMLRPMQDKKRTDENAVDLLVEIGHVQRFEAHPHSP